MEHGMIEHGMINRESTDTWLESDHVTHISKPSTVTWDMLTPSQKEIALRPFKPGEIMTVPARAGAAKTTTMYHFVRSHPNQKIRYFAFQKEVVLSAKKSAMQDLPNVQIETLDSIVFKYIDGIKMTDNVTGEAHLADEEDVVAFYLSLRDGSGNHPYFGEINTEDDDMHKVCEELSYLALETVEEFCKGVDPVITGAHYVGPPFRQKEAIAKLARDMFQRFKIQMETQSAAAPNNKENRSELQLPVPMIIGERLLAMREDIILEDSEIIIVDEAQDMNAPLIGFIFRHLPKAMVVLVGDSLQHIYGFKGTHNVLDPRLMPVPDGCTVHRSYLGESFRFGPNIARMANLMAGLSGEHKRQW